MDEGIKEKKRILQKRLDLYYIAEEKILSGQSYSIGGRSLTRANLQHVQNMIEKLEEKIAGIDSGGNGKRKVARVVPRDW